MKRYYSLLILLGLSITAASAGQQSAETIRQNADAVILEKLASMPATRSANSPETEFTANQARFYYYHDFYKDGKTACYQVVFTNSADGFSADGTLPAGPGQLVCLLLCGPQSADKNNPVLPAGTYKFAKTSGEIYTFGASYGHYVDAFNDLKQGLIGWQLQPEGGEISITADGDNYDVKINLDAGHIDEATDDEIHITVAASYNGKITVPGPFNELPGDHYAMELTGLTGKHDASQRLVALTFYGCPLDNNGFVAGKGDILNVFIYYTGNSPLADLPGAYSHVPYLKSNTWADKTFIGGHYFDYGVIIPTGTYCAHYNESAAIDACGFIGGGTIDIKADGPTSNGDLSFDFNLEAQDGTKVTGSWSGNVIGKIEGLESAGINDVTDESPAIIGMQGRIEAPEGARIFTLSGIETGSENLDRGLYIVLYNGKTTKVNVK